MLGQVLLVIAQRRFRSALLLSHGGVVHHLLWLEPADPAAHALRVLRAEAPEIPDGVLAGTWCQISLRLRDLTVNEAMVTEHDADPIHVARRDGVIDAIRHRLRLPPLIAIGDEHYLVDGFARLRALRVLGIDRAEVITNG